MKLLQVISKTEIQNSFLAIVELEINEIERKKIRSHFINEEARLSESVSVNHLNILLSSFRNIRDYLHVPIRFEELGHANIEFINYDACRIRVMLYYQ